MNLYHYFMAFFTSFGVVLLATPSLIKVAKLKHLVDEPKEDRKLHTKSIPTIGGIMIFSAFMFTCFIWFPDAEGMRREISQFLYLMGSLVLLFFVGVKDDIIGMSPTKKLVAHILVGFILVAMGGMRIETFHGLFSVDVELPEYAKLVVTIFVYIVIVNSINLIDGVDGLASGVGLIASLTFGVWFYYSYQPQWALVSFALAGALLSFLIFNFNPARIFMGDSGSLTIGAILSVLTIQLIETPTTFLKMPFENISTPVLAIGILAYPLIDTLRVFIIRVFAGKSPMSADRNHLHHKLQDRGFGHRKVVFIIYLFSVLCVALVSFVPVSNPTLSFLILGAFVLLFIGLVTLPKRKQ